MALCIRLSDNLEARLEKMTRLTGLTKSYIGRQALIAYLDRVEQAYALDKIAAYTPRTITPNLGTPSPLKQRSTSHSRG